MSLKTSNRLFSVFAYILVPAMVLTSVILGSVYAAGAFVPLAAAGTASTFSVSPDSSAKAGAAIGAGICCVGMVGSGLGQGISVGKALEALSRNPEVESRLRTLMFTGMAITESASLYAFVLSIMLIFVF